MRARISKKSLQRKRKYREQISFLQLLELAAALFLSINNSLLSCIVALSDRFYQP
jgi:hypothetical protein